jgi:anti-anti-sigma factor
MPQIRSATSAFRLTERDIWPGSREIRVEGELDLSVTRELRVALDRAAAHGLDVLVDFAACEFIDVSGVEALLKADEKLASQGRQLLLRGASGQVRRMLLVTGLAGANHAAVSPTEDDPGAAAADRGGAGRPLVR